MKKINFFFALFLFGAINQYTTCNRYIDCDPASARYPLNFLLAPNKKVMAVGEPLEFSTQLPMNMWDSVNHKNVDISNGELYVDLIIRQLKPIGDTTVKFGESLKSFQIKVLKGTFVDDRPNNDHFGVRLSKENGMMIARVQFIPTKPGDYGLYISSANIITLPHRKCADIILDPQFSKDVDVHFSILQFYSPQEQDPSTWKNGGTYSFTVQ